MKNMIYTLCLLLLNVFCSTANSAIIKYTTFPVVFNYSDHSVDTWDTLFFSSTNPADYLGYIDTMTNDRGFGEIAVGDTIFDSAFVINCASNVISFTNDWNGQLNNVVLYVTNDSVKFGQNAIDGATAVSFGNGNQGTGVEVNNIRIYGGKLLVGNPVTDSLLGGFYNNPISGDALADTSQMGVTVFSSTRAKNILIYNVNATIPRGFSWGNMTATPYNVVGGGQSRLIGMDGSFTYNIRVHGGIWKYHQSSAFNRCYYDNCAFSFTSLYEDMLLRGDFLYHVMIDSIEGLYSTGVGITVSGYASTAIAQIRDNYIQGDARSDTLWTTDITSLPGGGEPCVSKANAYGILLRNCGPTGYLINNIVTSGELWGGSRGIMIERTGSNSSSNYYIIDSNHVNIHEGYDPQYGDVEAHGLRVRYGDGTKRYRKFRWNEIIVTSDNVDPTIVIPSDQGKDFRGTKATALRYGDAIDNPTYDSFQYNIFKTYAFDSDNITQNNAVMWEHSGDLSSLYSGYNRIESDDVAIQVGQVNGGTDDNITHKNDTIVRYTPYHPDFVEYSLGYLGNSWAVNNMSIIDMFYLGGAIDKNVSFSPSTVGLRQIYFKRTVVITVNGNNALPIPNCSVFVWPSTADTTDHSVGNTIAQGITDASGKFEFLMTYYETERTATTTAVDYSSIIIAADYNNNSDNDNAPKTVSYTVIGGSETLTLPLTLGSGGAVELRIKWLK